MSYALSAPFKSQRNTGSLQFAPINLAAAPYFLISGKNAFSEVR